MSASADPGLGNGAEPRGVHGRARLALPDVLFVLLLAAAFGFLLFIGRFLTFFWDEFSWIYWREDWSFNTLMQPYNEHWSLVPLLIYKVLLATVGLRSYIPYLAVLLLLHVVTVTAIYRFARRNTAAVLALAVAAVLLFFGAGYENLLWAAGIFHMSAATTGVWGLVLALDDPPFRRPWAIAALLVLSVASSGVGLFFLAATGVALIATRERRRQLWIVLPAAITYGAWFVTLGRNAISGGAFTLDALVRVPEFIRSGVAVAVGSLVGLGPKAGDVLAPLLAVLVVLLFWKQRRINLGVVAGATGLIAQFVLTGLVRASFESSLSRYQYVAVLFILIIVVSLAREVHVQLRRPVAVGALAAIVVVSLAANVSTLFVERDWYLARADATRALFDLTLQYGGSPALPDDVNPGGTDPPPGLMVVASPAQLRQVVADYGSPVTDAISGRHPIPDAASDGVLFQIVKDYLVISPASALPVERSTISLAGSANVATTQQDGCLSMTATGGAPQIVVSVAGGKTLYVESTSSGDAEVYISQHGAFAENFQMNYYQMPGSKVFAVSAGQATSITLPDLGPSAPVWLVRLDPPQAGTTELCLGPTGAATNGATVP